MTVIKGEHTPDPSDRATDLEMAFTSDAIRSNQLRAKQVQQPRADGTYEFTDCEACGLEIDPQRLKVAPANNLCIHCAERAELVLKKFGIRL